MDPKKLKEFIKFMDENNLCELEIEEGGKRIRLKKGGNGEAAVVIPQPIAAASSAANPGAAEPQTKNENVVEIKSPMVGTFYRAPSPGAQSYVEIGDTIKPGDVVCIIEAMKLMNEIKAEVGGKIVDITVDNGEAVEFGHSLFHIEPL
jgi:acetyl-CoA carboxylase biotin carboxyl carrier protein